MSKLCVKSLSSLVSLQCDLITSYQLRTWLNSLILNLEVCVLYVRRFACVRVCVSALE